MADPHLRMPQTPGSSRYFMPCDDDLPTIGPLESVADVVNKLVNYLNKTVDAAFTYEKLRTNFAGKSLKPLILKLSDDCHHPAIVAALLAAKYIFESSDDEGTGLHTSRGLACEIVAWQFLTFLSQKELVDYLLYEIPGSKGGSMPPSESVTPQRSSQDESHDVPGESTPLLESQTSNDYDAMPRPPRLPNFSQLLDATDWYGNEQELDCVVTEDTLKTLAGMNALEIAAIATAKTFLSQQPVQRIVDDIWRGNVVFWESVSVRAVRKARIYNKRVADPYIRLRVPQYQKAFQIAFFVSFLALYYAVLIGPFTQHVTIIEALLYLWIAAFAYDEIGEVHDAGFLFYRIDFWSLWDLGIIGICAVFMATRIAGLVMHDTSVTSISFDILSMVALFLVPRIFSVMSLNTYFGSLIPVLKEMTKTFCKFLPVIVVLYLGFLTTFTMLSREHADLGPRAMSWLLVEVFFGSSYLGFDVALQINPYFGYPLMLIFVCLTNILLITSLVSLVSNSLTEVMAHARAEHLFQYTIYVLENSTSRRLTYFMPPLNLISLFLLRPLRLVLPPDRLRRVRIVVLKTTHIGFVAVIWAYESFTRLFTRGSQKSLSRASRDDQPVVKPLSASVILQRERYAERYAERPCPCALTTLTKATNDNAQNDSASGVADAEVLKLLQRLSSQVDELTAIVNGQSTE